ncbi:hypothetical protein [Clostridium baratii]|uniref:hypothetical protein n=1 Tax=Clostridium baratii TaxID=1561 RepID=UPI0030CC6E7C
MIIQKSKWKNSCDSAVMFMIDDLANKYIKLDESNIVKLGCDWGAKTYEENSFYYTLNKDIMKKFPYLKITMFLVVGRREPIINNGHKFYSEDIDANEQIRDFIKDISNNPMIELAYHGYTHGKGSDDIYKFKEEWETFNTLEEALDTIEKGKNLYKNVANKEFIGGKYCGYKYNEISDKSIAQSGFLWWCRHWEGELFFNTSNEELSFELEEFDGVIDIPSTIDGSFYTVKNLRKVFTKKYLKSILLFLKDRITIEKQIDYLVKNHLLISIQEHTAPYRVDDRIQYPNIISDKENIIYILNYLKKYNLWYATGTEIASYYKAYKYSNIILEENKIKIECDPEVSGIELTIEILGINKEITLRSGDETIKSIRKDNNTQIANIVLYNDKVYELII